MDDTLLQDVLASLPNHRPQPLLSRICLFLAKQPRFAHIPAHLLEAIGQAVRLIKVQPGCVIPNMAQGDVGDSMFVIVDGSCSVHVRGREEVGMLSQTGFHDPVASRSKRGAKGYPAGKRRTVWAGADNQTLSKTKQSASGLYPHLRDTIGSNELVWGRVVRVLERGATFGEDALAREPSARRSATIFALTDAILLRIDEHTYRRTLLQLQVQAIQTTVAALRQFAFFADTPAEDLEDLYFAVKFLQVERGHVLMKAGDPYSGIHLIQEGLVLVSEASEAVLPDSNQDNIGHVTVNPRPSQKMRGIALVGRGEALGFEAMECARYSCTGIAHSPCRIAWIPSQDVYMLGAASITALADACQQRRLWRVQANRKPSRGEHGSKSSSKGPWVFDRLVEESCQMLRDLKRSVEIGRSTSPRGRHKQ